MKRAYMIIFLALSLMFISGINGCEIPSLRKSISGYDQTGLSMKFSEETPRAGDELTDFSQFQVGVVLRSSMLNDVDGELCVYDSLSDFYGGIPSRECVGVSLVSADSIEGKIIPAPEERFIFPSNLGSYSYTNLQEDLTQNSVMTAVFRYNVLASADTQLCVKRDARVKTPLSCEASEVITRLNVNPAPVVVNKVVKKVMYGGGGNVGVNLDVYLKRIDDGEVISRDAIYNPDVEYENYIYYDVRFARGERFICSPGERVRFEENEKIIRCSATLNIEQDYINDPLVISLNYGFRKSITTGEIKIRKYEL